MEFNVKIRRMFDDDTALKAVCSVTLNNEFVVHNVKVIKTRNGVFTTMPYETHKDADGKELHRDVFHPITSDARKAMENAVLDAYETAVAEKTANNSDTLANA